MIGYTKEGKEIPKELRALEEVAKLLNEESLSLREAADYLDFVYGVKISHVGLKKRLVNGIYKKES